MSKIICDVCGTSYPETAAQCPICGCARPVDTHGTVHDGGDTASAGYTYVKGGRFSKANVRKRNMAKQAVAGGEVQVDNETRNNKNKWLLVTALILAAAVIAVVIYIVFHFFDPFGLQKDPVQTEPSTSATTPSESTDDTTEPTIEDVYCSSLTLSKTEIQLDSIGASYQLDVTANPADTTDKIFYATDDEDVATVTADGLVTAIAEGETDIFITCGSIQETVKFVCVIETEPPTEETTDPTEDTTAPVEAGELKLNREDFTLFYKGASWDVYDGELDVKAITWSSDNENIATVEDGKVVATGSGMTTIHAEYKGQKASCIVRCEFPSSGGSGGVTQDGNRNGSYKISSEDVTISVGEKFSLVLTDETGHTVSVSWSVSNSGICTVSGNTVTGVASGTAVVEVTYEGNYYSCIVRVK